ncbi:hypothetical protein BV20DRAFT_1050199 [Pilatotrama ljubarskyi]|nr:hypothetical protein BV20DRAFT_1050199 [Pilatotrama ljubarskyi]
MNPPKLSSDSRAIRRSAVAGSTSEPKHQRRGKKTLRTDIGNLTEVFNLPFDVFFEILSHLRPIDILRLSRTSKELRSMLLSRASRHIWIAARRNILPQMPDCPDHMSEARYAQLGFERDCDACGGKQSLRLDYATPVKLCSACWRENVKKGGDLARQTGLNRNAQREVLNLLPAAGVWNAEPFTSVNQTSKTMYYEPEFIAVAKRYQDLRQDKKKNALKYWIEERQAATLLRSNASDSHSIAAINWENHVQTERRLNEQRLQQERETAIEEKLRGLGYGRSEYPSLDEKDFYQLLHQPRRLTPRIWNSIQPELVGMLDTWRRQRAYDDLKQKWQRRRGQLEKHYVDFLNKDRDQDVQKRTLPGFEDALCFFLDILTAADPCADITEEEVAAAQSAVLAHADEYRARVRRDLAKVVRRGPPPPLGKESKKPRQSKNSKGKAKQKADGVMDSTDTDALDEAAELALLDAPTSLFRCFHMLPGNIVCRGYKPFLGMIEHWQILHGSTLWSPERVMVTDHTWQIPVERLATALGLPANAPLSTIEEYVRRGRPECSCGADPDEAFDAEPRFRVFDKLLTHVNEGFR